MAQNIFNSTMPRLVNPTTAVDESPQMLWSQVSNTLNQFANRQMAEWQDATIKNASKAGALEGQKENPEFREGTSLSAEAFNSTATKNYIAGLEVTAASEMAKIQQANLYNPTGYDKSAGSYINTITEKMKQNPATAGLAGSFSARMKLQAQAESYKISKNYMQQQGEQTKAANEDLFAAARQSAYMAASGVFSKDPAVQQTALGAYQMNKSVIETALHAVMPDGTPLYSPMAIQKRLQAYHQEFFVKGAQAYLTDNVSNKDLKALTDGTFSVKLPSGEQIDILREVGVDAYERQVRGFAFDSIRMKEAERTRQEAAYAAQSKVDKQMYGMETIGKLLSGKNEVSPTEIMADFKAGKLSASDAMAAVKLASDPEAGMHDSETVADLSARIIDGENVEGQIKQLAKDGELTPQTMKKLLIDNAKAQRGIVDDNKRLIKQLVVVKTGLGIEDPKSLAHAYDFQKQYELMVESGGKDGKPMAPELALEKVRNNIDVFKDRQNAFKYNSVPLFMVTNADGEIDQEGSKKALAAAKKAGRISPVEAGYEAKRLATLIRERRKK